MWSEECHLNGIGSWGRNQLTLRRHQISRRKTEFRTNVLAMSDVSADGLGMSQTIGSLSHLTIRQQLTDVR